MGKVMVSLELHGFRAGNGQAIRTAASRSGRAVRGKAVARSARSKAQKRVFGGRSRKYWQSSSG